MLDDPVIGSVELPFDNYELDPVPIGNLNPRVGDHGDVQSVSLRHSVSFLLYGAGIGIDKYFKHPGSFLPSVSCTLCTPLLVIETALHLHHYISPETIQARSHSGLST